jgi:hypothetical protein
MIMTILFWFRRHVDSCVDANVSEKHTVSIFRVEMTMLGSGESYTGLEEGNAEGMGQCFLKGTKDGAPVVCNILQHCTSSDSDDDDDNGSNNKNKKEDHKIIRKHQTGSTCRYHCIRLQRTTMLMW